MKTTSPGHTTCPGVITTSFIQSCKARWEAFRTGYIRFVERQGFLVILCVCIGVIAGTAIWTNQAQQPVPVPTPPVGDAASVAQLQQQSLRDVSTPTPAPTQAPVIWQSPVEPVSVLRGFHAARLMQSGVTGLWQLHDALDLRCASGQQIQAMADGTVVAASENGLLGTTVTIDHGQGVTVQYAGMALDAGLRVGDPVEAGQTIGFGGNTVMDETDLGPHLHLRITQNGRAVDPLAYLPTDQGT